jgi:hypothetical protein
LVKSPLELEFRMAGLHPRLASKCIESLVQSYLGSRVAAFKSLCASASARIERKGLKPSSALNEVNDQDDDGNYKQEVDQAAANVADEAKKPKND